jgi:hypothetical protein
MAGSAAASGGDEQGNTTGGEDEQGNTTGGEDEQGNTTGGEKQAEVMGVRTGR